MSDKPQQVAGQRTKEKLSAKFVLFPPPLKPVQSISGGTRFQRKGKEAKQCPTSHPHALP